jgi:hypothetical protein
MFVFGTTSALACPTCTCANPTLTTMGAEQPFAGRFRLGAAIRAWQQNEGADGFQSNLRELRLDVTASWSPSKTLSLLVNLPIQWRERTSFSLEKERGFGPGEIDVSARWVIFMSESFRPKSIVSLLATARVPSSPTLVAQEKPFAIDAQLGAGAVVLGAGLGFSLFVSERWSTFASMTAEVPFEGRYGLRIGPGAQFVLSAQFQPIPKLGFRAGIDGRYEAPSVRDQMTSTNVSGFLLQATADVVIFVTPHLLVAPGIRFSVLDARVGPIRTSPILSLSGVLDL